MVSIQTGASDPTEVLRGSTAARILGTFAVLIALIGLTTAHTIPASVLAVTLSVGGAFALYSGRVFTDRVAFAIGFIHLAALGFIAVS